MDEEKQPGQTPEVDEPTSVEVEATDSPADDQPETVEPTLEPVADNGDDSVEPIESVPSDEVAVDTAAEDTEPVVPHRDFASDEAGETRVAPIVEPEVEPATTPEVVQPSIADSGSTEPANSKIRLIILAVIAVLVLVGAGLIVWQMAKADGSGETVPENNTAKVEPAKLGVAVTVADGEVTYQHADEVWQPLTTTTQLTEGDVVRTGVDSRAVLTLDDGSAVRLDADTMVEIVSLAADDVRIEHLTGSVYSRVVPSERHYTVAMGETTYLALGTAFVTVNLPGDSGVQVYQSSVKSSAVDQAVGEGKQYYRAHSNANLAGQVTDISIDDLVDNEFVTWNLAQDEKDTKFKDKLGVLSDVKKEAEARADEAKRLADEAVARQKAEQKAADKQKTDKQKDDKKKHHKDKVKRGSMKLDLYGETLKWQYADGDAIYGYKLVWSYENKSPKFDQKNTWADYYPDKNTTAAEIPKPKKHKPYYVSVCAYTKGTEQERCVDYSNVITIKR